MAPEEASHASEDRRDTQQDLVPEWGRCKEKEIISTHKRRELFVQKSASL